MAAGSIGRHSTRQVIVLIDMDCFYVQVEKRLHPELVGQPCAIVQYNQWRGGSIIAVDYEARKYGVSRTLKGDEAKEKCPNIQLARVPEKRGKADLTNYRKASAEVMKVMSQFTSVIEKASIDEAYLDLTDRVKDYIDKMTNREIVLTDLPSTHVAGYDLSITEPDSLICSDDEGDNNDDNLIEKEHSFQVSSDFPELCQCDVNDVSRSNHLLLHCDGLQSDDTDNVTNNEQDNLVSEAEKERIKEKHRQENIIKWLKEEGTSSEKMLAVGAILTNTIRQAIFDQLGFTCSGGISYNKVLAKLAAGMNKPNQQTIFPMSQLTSVFLRTPFKKVRHLGGKMGQHVQTHLGIKFVGELQHYPLKTLQNKFGLKTGTWLYDISRGKCDEQVQNRTIVKSIGCGKNFVGPNKLKTVEEVHHWLEQLSEELVERLEQDLMENSRRAQSVTVHFLPEGAPSSLARSFSILSYDLNSIVAGSWTAMNKGHTTGTKMDGSTPLKWTTGILNINIHASKFISCSNGQTKSLLSFVSSKPPTNKDSENSDVNRTTISCVENEQSGGSNDPLPYKSQVKAVSSLCSHTNSIMQMSSSNKRREKNNRQITTFFTPLKRKQEDAGCFFSPPCKKSDQDDSLYLPTIQDEAISTSISGELEDDFTLTVCAVCGEEILMLVLQEHMDYHIAVDLQERLQADST